MVLETTNTEVFVRWLQIWGPSRGLLVAATARSRHRLDFLTGDPDRRGSAAVNEAFIAAFGRSDLWVFCAEAEKDVAREAHLLG